MNTLDWPRLVRLRERRVQHAREAAAHERRIEQAAFAAEQRALDRHAHCVGARIAHGHLLRDMGPGAVADARDGNDFARVLDRRIADAARGVDEAREHHAQCRAALDECLAALRAASAALQAAEELQRRECQALRRLGERRQDEHLDDAARTQWQCARRAA